LLFLRRENGDIGGRTTTFDYIDDHDDDAHLPTLRLRDDFTV